MYNSPGELFSSVACGSIWIFRLLFHTHLKQEPIKPDNLARNNLARALIFRYSYIWRFITIFCATPCLTGFSPTANINIFKKVQEWSKQPKQYNRIWHATRGKERVKITLDKQVRYITVRFHGRAWLLTLLWSDAGEFLRLLSEGKLPGLVSSSLFFKSDANGGVEDRFASIACERTRHYQSIETKNGVYLLYIIPDI